MSKLYKALVALPSRLFGITSGAVGIPAAFWPTWFERTVGAQVNADTIQTVGICLMALSIAYFALLWWLKPSGSESSGSTINTYGGVGIAHVSGGDFSQHTHNVPEKFRTEQEVMTYSAFEEDRRLNLGGLATLRTGLTYSENHVDMLLDVVPRVLETNPDPGITIARATIHFGDHRSYVFNNADKKRHSITVEGVTFVVTLIEIDPSPVPQKARPFRYRFSVAEK